MAFEEVVGQEALIKNLNKVLKNNTLSHAYLITGLKGIGKRKFSIALAKAILCQNINQEQICGGTCTSCKKIRENNHTEFHLIEQDGSIKIEDIREIQKNIHIKPYEGDKKVYIISGGEKMTAQAQNALLKTLEEPPGHSVIIITATNLKSMLPTIISRCQLLKLRPQGTEKVREYLVNSLKIPDQEARVIAILSNGLVEKALQLYNSEDFKLRRSKVIDITEKLLTHRTMDILNEMEFFNSEKDNIEEIIDLFIFWYRDILIYMQTKEDRLIINSDQLMKIQYQAYRISQLSAIRETIISLEEKKQQLKGNVNYTLAMEALLLNLQDLFYR